MTDGIKLIVGLGNPGREYETTRHNAGFWFLDHFASLSHSSLRKENKFSGWVAKIDQQEHSCWLLKPDTFMNDSGRAVAAVAQFYKIAPEEILVAHDELDFPAGTLRLKQGGGHGGHNGLRDIISCLSTADFYRLRIGIGHPGHKDRVTPYVLSAPSSSDRELLLNAIATGCDIIPDLIAGNFQKAMNALHE